MKFRSLAEAEEALKPFIPTVAEVTGLDITLERMWPMMDILGHPEKRLRIIHLAGTSGKTSTAYYLAALLKATNKKIGLHVSPHVDKVTERYQLNGQPISDELFISEMGKFLDIIVEHQLKPTYFELHTAFTYWFFDRQKVDYAVIETGMGGLHDSTNIAQEPSKLCVITDIGIDHTRVLGNTIPEIAFQKAGIIHRGNTVFMYQQAEEIMDVVTKRCTDVQAQLQTTTEAKEQQTYGQLLPKTFPLYQQRNWLLAYYVFRYVSVKDHLLGLSNDQIKMTQTINIPARMEIRQLDHRLLVMDSAHNAQKMEAFVNSFKARFPGKKATVLLALKQDKDYETVLRLLKQIADRLIITSFKTTQDLPVISFDPTVLAMHAKKLWPVEAITIAADNHKAYEALMQAKDDILVMTGSIYLLNQIRHKEKLA